MVPRLPGSAGGSSQVSVDDARGVPVFSVAFSKATPWGSSRKESKRLILSSATGDAIFAFCRDIEEDIHGGTMGLAIHHHSEASFGTLHADSRHAGCGYTAVAHQGFRVHFKGDFLLGNINITDAQGRLLAIAEPIHQGGGNRRSVRIGPLVDAGLVALAMLGIDLLEHQGTRSTRGGVRGALGF